MNPLRINRRSARRSGMLLSIFRRSGWLRGTILLLLVAGCGVRSRPPDSLHVQNVVGPVGLVATVDRPRARIAEPIQLTLTVTAPKHLDVTWPQTHGKLGKFVVVDTHDQTDMSGQTRPRWIRQYDLECYHAGRQTIPPIRVEVLKLDEPSSHAEQELAGLPNTLASAPLEVRIQSAVGFLARAGQIHDIAEVVDSPRGWFYWAWRVTVGVVGTLVLISGGWYLWRLVAPPGPTPRQWAMAALDRVEWQQLQQAWDAERTLDAVIDTVAQYLELRYRLAPLQRTTPELMALAAEQSELDDAARITLGRLLRMVEQVKFARLEASVHLVRQAFGLARTFVQQSTSDVPERIETGRREAVSSSAKEEVEQ